MDEFEPLPDWAFDDCEPWQNLLTEMSKAGLHLEVIESWRLNDGDNTRGNTMMCLLIRNEVEDIGTIIVRGRGRGRQGVDLWLGCEANTSTADQLRETFIAIGEASTTVIALLDPLKP